MKAGDKVRFNKSVITSICDKHYPSQVLNDKTIIAVMGNKFMLEGKINSWFYWDSNVEIVKQDEHESDSNS